MKPSKASPPLESITTKGAIFRAIAADTKYRKNSSPTGSCKSINKPFKPTLTLKGQCLVHCKPSTSLPPGSVITKDAVF